jgi:hypothetical protein
MSENWRLPVENKMKWMIAGFAVVLLAVEHAEATPLPAVEGATLNGISVAQAMGTAALLGEWRLRTGGWVRVLRVLSRASGECDTCLGYTLFVSAFGETSVPVDFHLFQGPETLGWRVPTAASPDYRSGKFTIALLACEIRKTATGFGVKGTSYVLHVGEDLKVGADGFGHFVHDAELEKLPEEQPNCASYYAAPLPPPPSPPPPNTITR